MKVIIVDDEKSTLQIMKNIIFKIPDIEIIGSFQSPSEAYKFVIKNKVDMAFVDINMPEESGLDFVKRVKSEVENIAVSFITAHKEYALEAFGVHAFDYIVKPISQSKLEYSIQIAKQRFVFLQPSKESDLSPKLFVNCFGNMEVKSADNETVQFTSTKSSELMAYLILKKGRFISKWSVMEDVFGGMPTQNAETYLNTTVYKLRKALEPQGMRSAIITADESYKIDIKNIYVDFIDFENRINLISDFNNFNQEEILKTEKLFSGELFGERDYNWCLAEKEKLSEVYLCYAKKLAGYLLKNNQFTGAMQIAKKLASISELDEEVNCLLMKIYATQRNKILLERQYKRYTMMLRSELGIVPEKMVVNLYTTLIQSIQ